MEMGTFERLGSPQSAKGGAGRLNPLVSLDASRASPESKRAHPMTRRKSFLEKLSADLEGELSSVSVIPQEEPIWDVFMMLVLVFVSVVTPFEVCLSVGTWHPGLPRRPAAPTVPSPPPPSP